MRTATALPWRSGLRSTKLVESGRPSGRSQLVEHPEKERDLMAVGKQVRLFLIDGTPGGMLTAEIMNWTGHVIAASRSDLADLLRREEAQRTGIYLLLGEGLDDLEEALVYIGEGDNVGERLKMHHRSEDKGGKDFWNRAIVLTSKDANLTKAHARYLESRFISIATAAGRAKVTNGTAPQPLPLPEADRSDMEYFVDQARIILPVLGVDALRSVPLTTDPSSPPERGAVSSSPIFEMTIANAGIAAHAQETDGEFAVLAGSTARSGWIGTNHSYDKLHEKLVSAGILVVEGATARFAKSHIFKSPSAAGAVISGRTANGRISWRVPATGLTYGQWQEQGITLTT